LSLSGPFLFSSRPQRLLWAADPLAPSLLLPAARATPHHGGANRRPPVFSPPTAATTTHHPAPPEWRKKPTRYPRHARAAIRSYLRPRASFAPAHPRGNRTRSTPLPLVLFRHAIPHHRPTSTLLSSSGFRRLREPRCTGAPQTASRYRRHPPVAAQQHGTEAARPTTRRSRRRRRGRQQSGRGAA
jgi:hypothetical protein